MPTKNPDVTRESILEAAFSEIYRHGFQAASLSTILQDTGLTKGALYHHFSNKQQLGLAVVDEVIRRRLDEMVFTPLRDADDPIPILRKVLCDRANQISPDVVKLGCPLNNLMQEMSPLDDEFKVRLNALLKQWQHSVRDALLRGQHAGRIRGDADCQAAALFIVSAYEGCVSTAKNIQSLNEFHLCLTQLEVYLDGLQIQGGS